MKATKTLRFSSILLGAVFFSGALITPAAIAGEKVLYFVRHAEKQNQLTEDTNNPGVFTRDCEIYDIEKGKICCTEELSDLGLHRRDELAVWLEDHGIQLDVVFSSHKLRTWQTVNAAAAVNGLEVDPLGPANCFDDGEEGEDPEFYDCDAGCESGKASIEATLDAIENDLSSGDTALIGQHSGTIYKIMDALGIDTSDEEDFPRNPENGKVAGYNNLWKITIKESGEARLKKHEVLDLTLERTN